MRKVLCTAIILGMLIFYGSEALAKPKKEKPATTSKKESQRTKEILEKKRKSLGGSAWAIEFALPGKTGQKGADVLLFKDNQFSSREFSAKGFKPTNYSLAMQDDGMVIFETMQTNENEGTVFWRGEFVQEGQIRGMFSEVLPKQEPQDTYFSGARSEIKEEQ